MPELGTSTNRVKLAGKTHCNPGKNDGSIVFCNSNAEDPACSFLPATVCKCECAFLGRKSFGQ